MPKTKTDRKLTLSIDQTLAGFVDSYVAMNPGSSRSEVFEEALLLWYREKQRKELEDYYTNLTEEEKREDKEWHQIAIEGAEQTWERK